MPEHEHHQRKPWPIEDIKAVLGGVEEENELFGTHLHAVIFPEEKLIEVEFRPAVEVVWWKRGSDHQHVVRAPERVEDGFLIAEQGDTGLLFISPTRFAYNPLWTPPAEAPPLPSSAPARRSPAVEVVKAPEGRTVVIAGRVLTLPEYYQAPSKGGGKEPRASFQFGEEEADQLKVVFGPRTVESVRRHNPRPGEYFGVKGYRRLADPRDGSQPVPWFWGVALSRDPDSLKRRK